MPRRRTPQRTRRPRRVSMISAPRLRAATTRTTSPDSINPAACAARTSASACALRGHDGKGGRPPGALADRGGLGGSQIDPGHQAADCRAGIGPPVLYRRKVLAEQMLRACDAGRERGEIGICRTGQHPHQDLMADLGGTCGRQGRQRRHRLLLVAAVPGRAGVRPARRRLRHASGSVVRASRGAAFPSGPGPPSTSRPPWSKPWIPMPERRPRSEPMRERRGAHISPCQWANARPIASAS